MKNLILGTVAAVFAFGSAYATLATSPIYIRAKSTASAPFSLQSVPGTCNDVGPTTCKVTVSTQTSPSGTETVVARSSAGVTLFSSVAGPINDTAITFYDVE